jgi:hypothetical protein
MAITGHNRMDAILFMTPPELVQRWCIPQRRESCETSQCGFGLEASAQSFSNQEISLNPRIGTRKARRRNAAATPVSLRSVDWVSAEGCEVGEARRRRSF